MSSECLRASKEQHTHGEEPVLLFVRSSNRPRQSPQTWGAAEIQNTQHSCFLFVRISAQESGANQTKSSVISICDARLSIVALLSSPPLSLSLFVSLQRAIDLTGRTPRNRSQCGDEAVPSFALARTSCPPPQPPQKKTQVTSPTACGALFSARTTPQPSQNLVEPWWNPSGSGIVVEPSWNLPQGCRTETNLQNPEMSC